MYLLGAFEAVLNRENPTFEELQQHLDIPYVV